MTTPELAQELIAEAMTRAEKVACTPDDQRRLALPDDVESAQQTGGRNRVSAVSLTMVPGHRTPSSPVHAFASGLIRFTPDALIPHRTVMTDSPPCCPTCGALLHISQEGEDAPAASSQLWQCAHGHWWLQSPVFGWMAIDPAASEPAAATATGEEE